MKRIISRTLALFFSAMCFMGGTSAFAEGTVFLADEYLSDNFDNFSGIDMVPLVQKGSFDAYTIGQDTQPYKAIRYVAPFEMNRYETTYTLWYKVRIWAEANGYHFMNLGQQGSTGIRGRAPGDYTGFEPVTTISWYDAIVWCNALSEMTGRTPCYTYEDSVLRDSRDTASCDLCSCNWNCNGYRLPSEAEWEYAARKTPAGMQRGDFVSGQVNSQYESDAAIPAGELAWFYENATGTHVVGTAGTPFEANNPPSPGSGNPNASGLFDMSGNVLEYCWDWNGNYAVTEVTERYTGPEYGAERIVRGGSWSLFSMFLFAGDRYAFDPNESYNYIGFRICASVE